MNYIYPKEIFEEMTNYKVELILSYSGGSGSFLRQKTSAPFLFDVIDFRIEDFESERAAQPIHAVSNQAGLSNSGRCQLQQPGSLSRAQQVVKRALLHGSQRRGDRKV